jgi:hypothetical protein
MGKLKLIVQTMGCLILTMLFYSCTHFATTESMAVNTPTIIVTSKKTQTAQHTTPIQPIYTPTPYYLATSTASSISPVATKTDEQVYIDPEGWYSVFIPADWKENEIRGSFSGENGFFGTGYLPEMMFMQHTVNICQWLANIDSKSTYFIYAPTSLSNKASNCMLTTLPGMTRSLVQVIIENPTADYEHRFFYIKTDTEHYEEIISTFAWLRPVARYEEPSFHLMPLRPEDASFWENTAPMPIGFSIEEYKLPEEAQNESPSRKIFLEFITPDAPQEERKAGTVWFSDTYEDINEKIKPFGYELRPTSQVYLYQLYKDETLLLDNIYKLPKVYRFSTSKGERIAFIVRTLKDPNQLPYATINAISYLVQNDLITKWEGGPGNPMDPELPPILKKDELLWLQVGKYTYVQVQNSNCDVLFSFATYFGARLPVNGFKAWDDHWILEVSDFVIQDGEILNEKFGFEEVFDWHLIDGKPFYFFRKGPRVGISYNGQFLPVYYHDVAHGLCCGLALNNPRVDENTVRFFSKRDGVWYYVVVEIH